MGISLLQLLLLSLLLARFSQLSSLYPCARVALAVPEPASLPSLCISFSFY